MKHFMLQLLTDTTGKTTPSVYTHDNENNAVADFHTKLGTYMKKSSDYNSVLCVVIRADGYIAREEYKDLTSDSDTVVAAE